MLSNKKKLNGIMIIVVLGVGLSLQQGCIHEGDYSDEQFDTIIDRDLALQEYARKAEKSTGEKKKKYLIKFFKAFPRDFKTYFKLNHNTCYGDTLYTIQQPYGYVFSHNPWGKFYPKEKIVNSMDEIPKEKTSFRFSKDVINAYYGTLYKNNWLYTDYNRDILEEVEKVVPAEIYYRKMISVCIGGFSDEEEYFYKLASLEDDMLFVKILEERTDDEIASYFYFGYDGPHPDNFQKHYDYRYQKISAISARVAELMKKAYTRLLSEEHCPGH